MSSIMRRLRRSAKRAGDAAAGALAVGLLRKHRGGAKHSAEAAEPEAGE